MAPAADRDTVDPGRPNVSSSVSTVPAGMGQVEAGAEWARTRVAASPDTRRLALQTTLRAGLTERLEARLEGEPVVRLRDPESETDVGDVEVGIKYRFLDAREGSPLPGLGVLPFVKLPTAQEPIGSGQPDFGMRGLASVALPADLSLDVNAGLALVGQSRPSGYLLQALLSASLTRAFFERLAVFGEVFYESRDERRGRDVVGVDAGLIWLVTRRLALDVAVGTSLAGDLPDRVVRAGLTVRFGR